MPQPCSLPEKSYANQESEFVLSVEQGTAEAEKKQMQHPCHKPCHLLVMCDGQNVV